VALTVSPMMCSRILSPEQDNGRSAKAIDPVFEKVHSTYSRWLRNLLCT